MTCPRCRTENRPGARFCKDCGQRLEAACPACGGKVEPGSKFCDGCGAPLDAPPGPAGSAPPAPPAPEAAPAAERFAAPGHYTPRHLAERILTSRSAVEGERKQVTVLFADLKGSMELLAGSDPEEARQLLDPVVERMMEAVHHYEGTVNQVMGDGIMALFGAPLALEDHAVRACYAALRMQESVQAVAPDLERAIGAAVRIRVGLNSGEVVVRSIGSDLHMDYSAIGQTVHLAARMEQMATPGAIQLTPETARQAEGYIEVVSRGLQQVKGLPAPTEIFDLVGMGPARRRIEASAARGLTRFVGREGEVAAIGAAIEEARGGRGRTVAVVGEAGVGKSRLFWELLRSPLALGFLVLESSSVSYGRASPYLPVIDMLKRHLGVENRDGHEAIRARVRGRLEALGPELADLASPLLALLDVPVDDAPWHGLSPPQRRSRTLEALRRLVLSEARERPVILVFEDLHWADSETHAFLDSLRGQLPSAPILLLVNYRPEYEQPWRGAAALTEIRLEPLATGSAEALLDGLLGPDPGLASLRRELMERTLGNPFFLEESVRMLVETQVLAGERGAYRLGRLLEAIRAPSTVQAILAARIDRLPDGEKRLLQAAAVIGKHVPLPLLEAIADVAAGGVSPMLAHLQAREFLLESSLFPDPEYTFKHALTHEVAYGTLLLDQRRRLHGSIALAIERLFPDRLAEHVDRLARHALQGEMWERAIRYSAMAGAKATARAVYREAVTCYEQALAALGRAGELAGAGELAVDLRLSLRSALLPLGEFDRIVAILREVEPLAEAGGDAPRIAQVYGFMTQALSWVGDHAAAIESGRRAQEMALRVGELGLVVAARYRMGNLHMTVGDYRRGIAVLGQALDSLDDHHRRQRLGMAGLPAVLCLTSLLACLAEMGDFAAGERRAQECLRLAEEVDHAFDRVNAHYAAGFLYLRQGLLDRATALLERGLRLAQAADLRAQLPSTATCLGLAHAMAGRHAEGLALLEQAVGEHASLGLVGSRSWFLLGHAQGLLAAGRLEEAERVADEAGRLAARCGERGYQAWAEQTGGEALARRGGGAEPALRRALALAEELEMRPLEAWCRLGLGRLRRAAGGAPPGRDELERARQLFTAMGMPLGTAAAAAALG